MPSSLDPLHSISSCEFSPMDDGATSVESSSPGLKGDVSWLVVSFLIQIGVTAFEGPEEVEVRVHDPTQWLSLVFFVSIDVADCCSVSERPLCLGLEEGMVRLDRYTKKIFKL